MKLFEGLKNQIKNGVSFDTISGGTAEKLLKTVSEIETKLKKKAKAKKLKSVTQVALFLYSILWKNQKV